MKTNRERARIPAQYFAGLALLFLSFALAPGVGAESFAPAKPAQAASALQSPPADTFSGGYATVEGMQAFLDAQVASHPNLTEKVDFGDSWCKIHQPCTKPGTAFSGYDLLALHITSFQGR